MSSFLRGTYIRPAPKELIGETALLQERDGSYMAQFDNLEKFSRYERDHAISWRRYSKDSFQLIIGDTV